jgi:hypothetical protein
MKIEHSDFDFQPTGYRAAIDPLAALMEAESLRGAAPSTPDSGQEGL